MICQPVETKYKARAPTYNRTVGGFSDISSFTGFSSAITGVHEIMYALPGVRQGTDTWQRIGNKIKPVKLTVTLDLTATFHESARSVDKTVHIFLMTSKSVKHLDNYSAIPILQMLKNGANGTSVDFDGTVMRSFMPVDTDHFTVLKHKKFRLCKGYGLIVDSTNNTSVAVTDSVIMPSQSYKRIKMNVKCPQTLLYQSATEDFPTNFAPFFVIGYTNNVGNDVAPNGVDVMVQGLNELYYKDE